MADRPLVSIIIPNYNKGKWLAETLFSAFGQTYSPLEIVVYDDGSTDQSSLILQTFIGVSNFRYIRGISAQEALPYPETEPLNMPGENTLPFWIQTIF